MKYAMESLKSGKCVLEVFVQKRGVNPVLLLRDFS